MKISTQQITARGIEQQSGLEIYNNVTTYNGEYINWGNALAYGTQLNSDTQFVIPDSASDPQVQALTSAPPSIGWNRYHTNTGTNYHGTTSPTSSGGYFTFPAEFGSGGSSYSGMYQKMSTVTGTEYKIDIAKAYYEGAGVLYVNTYFPRYSNSLGKVSYKINSSANTSFIGDDINYSVLTSNFTAKSINDVIVIYFVPTVGISSVSITNISVKEKREDFIPIYANDLFGNAHKVLRISSDETLSNV